jgi:hypothetical protein
MQARNDFFNESSMAEFSKHIDLHTRGFQS